MQESYGNAAIGYAGQDTAPQRQKHVLQAHSELDNEQERTFKLVEELENALQGVLSSPNPTNTEQSGSKSEPLPPLGELIRTTRLRQGHINSRLSSIIGRLEV
jgi:hypothetical protein